MMSGHSGSEAAAAAAVAAAAAAGEGGGGGGASLEAVSEEAEVEVLEPRACLHLRTSSPFGPPEGHRKEREK